MNVKDYIKAGQAIHTYYGLVAITGAKSGAKAMINIRCIQRGKGWNELLERYEIYRDITTIDSEGHRTIRRGFTNKDQYGAEDTVHIKTLTKI